MAKILFNDELFNISEAALNAASERIIRVLSSVMNGTGATINFGGTIYNIDSTKLSTVTNSFVSHLGTVSGSGMKVSVGGVEYNIDSSKMSNAVSQLHTVLSGLQSGENGDRYDDTYPIEWNTAEVVNNPLFALITGLRMVKISNLTPSAEELGTATLTAEVQGQTIQATLFSFGDFDGDKNVSYVHFETPLGEIFITSVHIPTNGVAPGLYISDVYTMAGVNADCRLELAPSNTTTITWDGNTEGLVSDSSGMMYKVSDLILTDEQVKNSVIEVSTGEIFTIKDVWDEISVSENAIGCEFFLVARVSNPSIEGEDSICPEAGVYFIKAGDGLFLASMTFPS